MLTLPFDLEAEFRRDLEQLEQEQGMKYVTSFERIARREELLGAIELGLELKFGNEGLALMQEISVLYDIERLRLIKEGIKTVSSVSELRQIYQPTTGE
ncbi:MAG: hypothetical protein HC836_34830 [Richelia sp. RM2_1_2]|nr:hypothetical protein [Richelia sp. SM2_1_7]NJM21726.1 hypothetical protein [Richelia sp. SM1_7_0]NJN12190.1 hypothetical protein [Richelia sp. RM1_1_1]NJO30712.1 hypothetical protein [Richelia sp. SL_2_1]NJO63212.1 hypothetical protein [Richelia sp. RM2_1_2]